MFEDILKAIYGSAYREGKLTPDFGVTEAYAQSNNQALSPDGGSQILGAYDPGGSTSGAILTNDQGTTGTFNELYGAPGAPRISDPTTSPPPTNTDNGGGGTTTLAAPTGDPNGNDGGLSAQIELARGAYNNRLGDLGRAFGEARGVYDRGLDTLGKRRGEFTGIFNQGNADILNSFEGERGNLQRSATENTSRLRNILRATGMGGSAFTRGVGNQDKANLRNLGALSNEKTFNERENLKGYNTNNEWANNQESTLGDYLRNAQGNYQSGVEKAGLVNAGDIAGINSAFDQLRSNIVNQQLAMQAAGGNINAYAANPFAPNLSDMTNSLNVAMPNFATPDGGNNQAANLGNENLSYLDRLKQRAGGSMYA